MKDGDTFTVTTPAIWFQEPEDQKAVVIPEGHAAIVLKEGMRPARVDVPPGEHVLSGTCMNEIDAPFAIVILPRNLADVCAMSLRVIDVLTDHKLDS